MIDIVLVSTPIATPNGVPPAGIFSLRSSLEKNGFTVVCIDGNKFNSTIEIQIEIDKYEFKWLGISILTDRQIKQGLEIGAEYDNVIYGGPPVNWRWDDPDFIPKGHHYIKGEGEVAIVEFLKGNLKYPGIDGTDPIEIKDLNNLPPPDYSGHNYNTLILTGSRGCVRKCNFCNVYEIWKTFRYVDGEVLAKQMIEIVGSNKKKQIFFSDSLINGSDKHFKKMCNYLIENNHKIPWRAQFIIRKKPQDYFDMVAKAGAVSLHIGIESVSEKIRYDMNKRITDIDMYDNIDGLLKAGIPKLVLMFIVG